MEEKITEDASNEHLHEEIKTLRRAINGAIRHGKAIADVIARGKGGREVALGITKLQEARMWVGEALGEMGHKLPEEFRDEAQLPVTWRNESAMPDIHIQVDGKDIPQTPR